MSSNFYLGIARPELKFLNGISGQLNEGDELMLECSVAGATSDVTYTIQHKNYDGSSLEEKKEGGVWKTVHQGHRYVVTSVTNAAHAGWYRCNAANSAADRNSFRVEVQIPGTVKKYCTFRLLRQLEAGTSV